MSVRTMSKISTLFSRGFRHASHSGLQKSSLLSIRNPKSHLYNYSTSNAMKVTILGASGEEGKSVALMLKQSPLIDELCLFDENCVKEFTEDLNYIDTKCKVISYSNAKEIQQALARSNVILVFACSGQLNPNKLFDANAPIVKEIALSIAKYSPKSVIAIRVEPINSIVPLFVEIMKKHGYYNPYAIFGVTTIDVVRANKFVADVLGLDPECVQVPVVGGHSEKTLVPLLSKATPCHEFTNEELEDITQSVRKADENLAKVRSEGAYLSQAFATARFVISLVKGLRGHKDIEEYAYVKTKDQGQLKYMISPVLLGSAGIAKHLDIPEMSDYEACLFENAIPVLMDDIKKGEHVGARPLKIVDGKLQEGPLCDPCDPGPKGAKCPPDHCELQALFADKQPN